MCGSPGFAGSLKSYRSFFPEHKADVSTCVKKGGRKTHLKRF